MGQRYETVLFDADNTLLDFDAAEEQALRRTMETRGIAFTPQRRRAYGAINRALWDALSRGEVEHDWLAVERFRRFGALVGSRADPVEWDREYVDKLGDCGALLPGALELLQALKPRCVIALATNGLREVQRKRLRGSPILPYLDQVFISQEMGVGKPARAFFEQALARLGASPRTAVMVGDDPLSDIQGAFNAGIDSILYSPNGRSSPLATYQVGELSEIEAIVLGREK